MALGVWNPNFQNIVAGVAVKWGGFCLLCAVFSRAQITACLAVQAPVHTYRVASASAHTQGPRRVNAYAYALASPTHRAGRGFGRRAITPQAACVGLAISQVSKRKGTPAQYHSTPQSTPQAQLSCTP